MEDIDFNRRFGGVERLYGKKALDLFQKAHVCVIGIGGVGSWAAEALKNTMPASVFSRSTECHNQDKVSMGTIAARDCLRVLELTEQVAAGLVLALTQAITLRQQEGGLQNDVCQAVQDFYRAVSEEFELVTEDRPLDDDLRKTIDFIQKKKWTLY